MIFGVGYLRKRNSPQYNLVTNNFAYFVPNKILAVKSFTLTFTHTQ